MKDHRHLASQRDSSPFEAEPLPQHDPNGEARFPYGRQQYTRFVQERTGLAITASRDVAAVVNFARSEAPRREPEPGSNGARLIGPMPGMVISMRQVASPCTDLMRQPSSAASLAARHLPRLKKRHNGCSNLSVVRYQSENVLIEEAASSLWHNPAKLGDALDEAGQRVWRGRCATEPAAIAATVRRHVL